LIKLKLRNLNSQKGFTLIEIMTVIAIMGILIAVAVVNSGRNPDRDVRLEKDRLVTFLRDVQNMSLSAEQVSETGASACYDTSYSPHKYLCNICGYGVREDNDGNIQAYYVKRTDPNADCSLLAGESGQDYAGKIFLPRNDVTISGLGTSDRIFFLIPNGDIYENGSQASSDITINISKTDASTTADVDVTIAPGGIIR
jgi:prepilin-type N-terminal cleavage/methylation domain-containing protein